MTDTARATGRPWALVRHFASAKVVKEIGPRSHRKIATVSAFGGLNDIDIANATLIVSAVNEYDALKAVEAAARDYVQWQRPADSHCVECAQPKDACESGRNCSSGLFRAALAALDAIRKEVAR